MAGSLQEARLHSGASMWPAESLTLISEGEVKVILVNNGQESLSVRPGDRVGQLILEKYAKVNLQGAEDLTHTLRGGEGFGSTGVAVRSLSELRSERLHCRDRG